NVGDEESLTMLSNLIMNYPEGSRPTVPEGGGRSENASTFTVGERTRMWNTAVRDYYKNKSNEE
ncbi:MAG: hypothetical protein AAFY36_14840, partial [Bacteroidota bacterium]